MNPWLAGLARRRRSRGLLAEMVGRRGGCLLHAGAAAELMGAEVSVVMAEGEAVALHGGFVLDGFGATPVVRYPAKLARHERLKVAGFRAWRPSDLTEAVMDEGGLEWLKARLVGGSALNSPSER